MEQMLSYADILKYGKEEAGVLCLAESLVLTRASEALPQCLLVSMEASFKGEPPHIFFRLTLPHAEAPLYQSHAYRLGREGTYIQQSFRVPPMLHREITLSICVEVPQGSTLYLKSFSVQYAPTERAPLQGLRFNAHLGFIGMSPNNTLPAFELAALCGFHTCIAVPKVTADGVLVCLHDVTINRAARMLDGSELPDTPLYVSKMTYEELLQYDFGIRKGSIYKGTKIPSVEEFFSLCARTGMRPMFSTHPPLPKEKWREIKQMLIRYGLLRGFHVKSGDLETIRTAWEIFGAEIDGYTLDVQKMQEDTVEGMLATGVDVNACRVGIEVRVKNYKEGDVPRILAAGMFAAAWDIPRSRFDELYARLIAMGVTEFTEDHHCSMGLDF